MDIFTTLTGNLGTEPDFRLTPGGMPAGSFRLATTPRLFKDGQWQDGDTTWVTVNCTWALAENMSRSLKKGDSVIVEGRLRTQNWTDANGLSRDRLIIDAVAIGHDLTRGTSTFTRSPKRERPEPAPEPADDREPSDRWEDARLAA
ncbi:MAG: single-stranded DNA-binding protein [Propionibacteriaceae bacterium]|jgi:single-strand DNA-binding protein|nr:single-stranded DNA-binding protein [Propionibacteriaceae bacterium]